MSRSTKRCDFLTSRASAVRSLVAAEGCPFVYLLLRTIGMRRALPSPTRRADRVRRI